MQTTANPVLVPTGRRGLHVAMRRRGPTASLRSAMGEPGARNRPLRGGSAPRSPFSSLMEMKKIRVKD